MIRAAGAVDIPVLQEIEVRAGEPFAAVGMDAIAGDEPLAAEVLGGFVLDDRAWVWEDADRGPVGYLIASIVDGNAHIDQVSVLPEYRGAGIGRRLIDRAVRWAADHQLPAITLTTFTEVPWNGPVLSATRLPVPRSGRGDPEPARLARGRDRATASIAGLAPACGPLVGTWEYA